jgi:hypothetical protein
VIVDVDVAGAGDADLAHLAGDEGRVAGDAAAGREDAVGGDHAAEVFGAGLDAASTTLCPWRPVLRLGALNTTLPEAAPGPAANPVAISRPSFFAAFSYASRSNTGCSKLVHRLRDRPSDRVLGRHQLLLTMSWAIFTYASAVRLPLRVCSM